MHLPDDLSADLALINGKIITLDSRDSIQVAVSMKNGKILRVGTNQSIKDTLGRNTKLVNLEGKTVLPGLIDSHMHPGGSWGAYIIRGVACGPDFTSVDEILENIKKKVSETPKRNWILGYSMDDVKMGRYPTKQELDSVSPEILSRPRPQ